MSRRRRRPGGLIFGGDPVAAAEATIEALSPLLWWKFDEGSGTTVTDYGSAEADGSLGAAGAAPTWTSEGLSFDGGDNVATTGGVNVSGDVMSAVWVVNSEGMAADEFWITSGDLGDNTCAWFMAFSNSNVAFRVSVVEDGQHAGSAYDDIESTAVNPTADEFHAWGFTYSGTAPTIYVDGEARAVANTISSTGAGIFNSAADFLVGALLSTTPTSGLSGTVAYGLVFDAELTAQEMSDVYDALVTIMSARGIALP